MRKLFTTNLLLLLFVNILIKPFWIFGIDRTVQNTLGAGEYGIFYTLFNFSLLLNILLDFGITNFNNREISRHPQMLAKYLSNIVGIKMILALFYGFITLFFAFVLGYSNREIALLLILVVNQFLSSITLYFRSNLNGLQQFRLDSALSVLDKTLMIAICSIMLWTRILPFEFSIELFVLAQTVCYVVTALVAFLFVLKKSGKVVFRVDFPFTISMLRSSFPYALLVLLMTIYGRIDSVMIERILPDGDVAAGVYAQAFRLLDAANMFPFLFASLLLPIFSKMIKNNQKISSFVGFSSTLLLVPVIAFAIPSFVFRKHLMDLLYHEHTAQSSEILGILMGSFVFIAIGYIFGTLLTALGDLRRLNYVSFMAVLLSIAIQLVLVGKYNVIGAAYGNLITNGFVALLTAWVSLRQFQFTVNKTYLIRILLFMATSLVTTLLLFYIGSNSLALYLLALLSILVSSLLYRLISLKEFVSFFTKESTLE